MSLCMDKICRTCMTECATFVTIWPSRKARTSKNETSSIARMLETFTAIHASKGDGLPEKVCIVCSNELRRAFLFKQKCETSDSTLRAYLNKIGPSETELSVIRIPIDEKCTVFAEDLPTLDSIKNDGALGNDAHKNYQCAVCLIEFDTNTQLKQHFHDEHEAIHAKEEIIDERSTNSDDGCDTYEDMSFMNEDEMVIKDEINIEEQTELTSKILATKKVNLLNTIPTDFQCEYCQKFYADKKCLTRHIKIHLESGKCTKCQLKFTKREEYLMHMRAQHPADKKYKCTLCSNSYDVPYALKVHLRMHTGEKPYECKICGKGFATNKMLGSHMKLHQKGKSFKCTECEYSFLIESELKAHFRVHTGEGALVKPFECTFCSRTFSKSPNLRYHMRQHTGEKPYECKVCHLRFPRSETYKKHMRVQHNIVERSTHAEEHRCTMCPKVYSAASRLYIHMRTHSDQPGPTTTKLPSTESTQGPVQCDYCQKFYADKRCLSRHIRIHLQPEECAKCQLKFTDRHQYLLHMKMEHPMHKKHKCTMCLNSYDLPFELRAHMRTHTGERPFVCETCGKGFTDKKKLSNHMRLHQKGKSFDCTECEYSFLIENELRAHLRTHTGEPPIEKNYECIFCSRLFYKFCNLKYHMRQHTGEQPFKCKICRKRFTRSEAHKKHMRVKHNIIVTRENAERYTCPFCLKVYQIRSKLKDHMRMHTEEKPFACSNCPKRFDTGWQLKHHMIRHSDTKSFKCPECEKSFLRKSDMKEHLSTHGGEYAMLKKHKCTLCPKSFYTPSKLKSHMEMHTGLKSFLCAICGKGFPRAAQLAGHMLRHNNAKTFKCTECDSSFITKATLNIHFRTHTGERPYECDVCGHRFGQKSALKEHQKIHTGEKPYACEFCPLRFTRLSTLTNHRRTHTGERPHKCTYPDCERAFAQRSDYVKHMGSHTDGRPYQCTQCTLSFKLSGDLKTHQKCHKTQGISTQ